jgi:RNA polymerase sigma-70 factor (ECF subfamily)
LALHKNIDNLSDTELLQYYYNTHNNEYLGALLQRYTLLLFGTCMKYLKNENLAKDAVQQVFEKVIQELPKYKVEYFKSWIYIITKNHCLMQLRQKHHQTLTAQIEIEHEDFSVDELLQKENLLQLLEASISDLPYEQALCVDAFYMQKKSYKQIENETGFSSMQVKSAIQNGKRNLKRMLLKHINKEA